LRELLEVLRTSLVKFKEGHVYSPFTTVELFHREHALTVESRDQMYTEINATRWDLLSTLSIHLLGRKYNTLILQRALESSAFLTFDASTGEYREEPVYEALWHLAAEIRSFNQANTAEVTSVVFAHTPRKRPPGQQSIPIETMKLLPFLHLLDRWINIIELSLAIVLYLRGNDFTMPRLRPPSPIPDMNQELERERVSLEDVEVFITERGS
jgi:hypothetical protein